MGTSVEVAGPFSRFSADPASDCYESLRGTKSLGGTAEPRVVWLAGHGASRVRQAPAEPLGLLAGVVRMGIGLVELRHDEPEEAYLIEGLVSVSDASGIVGTAAAGDCLSIDPPCTLRWRVEQPIKMVTVRGGKPATSMHSGRVRVSSRDAPFANYSVIDARDNSSTTSRVRWIRDGPEGSGEFFAGLWRTSAMTYRKRFVADEFVLVLHGSITLDCSEGSIVVAEGDIGLFQRDIECSRVVSDRFSQWFAGR